MVTPAARREAVARLCTRHGVSQRQACRAIGAERTSIRYRSRRPDDGTVRSRLRELAAARRRIGRKRAALTRMPLTAALGPNQRWSMDFVHDALVDGRRFRTLAVVDDYTRENLCLVADTSLPGGRVIRELEAVVARRGLPRQCVSDNGPEFTGLARGTTGAVSMDMSNGPTTRGDGPSSICRAVARRSHAMPRAGAWARPASRSAPAVRSH